MYHRTVLVYLCLDHPNIASVIGLDYHPEVELPSPVMLWYSRLNQDLKWEIVTAPVLHRIVGTGATLPPKLC